MFSGGLILRTSERLGKACLGNRKEAFIRYWRGIIVGGFTLGGDVLGRLRRMAATAQDEHTRETKFGVK